MRMDLVRPDQVAQAVKRASIAYVPIGAVEYHGPHLPLGVDMVTAAGVCERACVQTGGVVLPPSYLAIGTLDLPWTLCFSNRLVERWAEEIVDQLHSRGFAQVVLVTGHGPLDFVHLLKRVARSRSGKDKSAYTACYLEFNAALLAGPELDEPTVIDHASTVETSWMLALQPETVDLRALPEEPHATPVGVYGRNPRFTASASRGTVQLAGAARDATPGRNAGRPRRLAHVRALLLVRTTRTRAHGRRDNRRAQPGPGIALSDRYPVGLP